LQRVDNTREDARILYHQGYYEEAILLLQDWLTQYPDDASGWEILAAALFHLQQYEDAERAARHAVELWPSSARTWSNWGTMLRKLGRHDEAWEAQTKARRLDPMYERPHVEMAKLPPPSKALQQRTARSAKRPEAAPEPYPVEHEQDRAEPMFLDEDEYRSYEDDVFVDAATNGEEYHFPSPSYGPPPAQMPTAEQPPAYEDSVSRAPRALGEQSPPAPMLPSLPSVGAPEEPPSPVPDIPAPIDPPTAPELPSPGETPIAAPAPEYPTTTCPRCGHTVPEQTYCVHCGRVLEEPQVSAAPTQTSTRRRIVAGGFVLLLVGLLIAIAVFVSKGPGTGTSAAPAAQGTTTVSPGPGATGER